MTNRKAGDLTTTIAVLEGKRDPIEDNKTWLRHREDSEAGQIDLHLIQGASISEIAESIPCREQRVSDHFNHLQDGPSTMEPHRLRLMNDSGIWSFDLNLLKQSASTTTGD